MNLSQKTPSPRTPISEEQFRGVFRLRDLFAQAYRGVKLYEYQKEVSDLIIRSVLENKGDTIVIEFSRQSGKTEVVCITVSFLKIFVRSLYSKLKGLDFPLGFNIGIFAPQIEQAKTDFDRIKLMLSNPLLKTEYGIDFIESNGNTLRLAQELNTTYCFSASIGSHTESKTMNLIILEEAQDILREKITNTIEPMGSATNATTIYIGTAGYQKCKFLDVIENQAIPKEKKTIVDFRRVIRERMQRFKETGDERELNYFKYLQGKLAEIGVHINTPEELENLDMDRIDSESFKTQYALMWMLEKGQYITLERMKMMEGDYEISDGRRDVEVFVGVDFGKMHDSTVVTVGDVSGKIIAWKEIRGEDYETQFLAILHFLSKFSVKGICCDATATQDMMVDRFRKAMSNMSVSVIGVNFGTLNSELFKFMDFAMRPAYGPTGDLQSMPLLQYPKTDCSEKERFLKQFLDLQKEIDGKGLWRCKAPEGPEYFDDYCDSTALYLWNFKYYEPIQSNLKKVIGTVDNSYALKKKIEKGQLSWQDKLNMGYLKKIN